MTNEAVLRIVNEKRRQKIAEQLHQHIDSLFLLLSRLEMRAVYQWNYQKICIYTDKHVVQ